MNSILEKVVTNMKLIPIDDSYRNIHQATYGHVVARDVAEMDDNVQPIPVQQIIQALTYRGQQQLNELMQEEYLEGQILTNSPFIYQREYDLGDIPTIQNLDWGITMDARITDVKESYEEAGFNIEE